MEFPFQTAKVLQTDSNGLAIIDAANTLKFGRNLGSFGVNTYRTS
jgi:hypothetical protein